MPSGVFPSPDGSFVAYSHTSKTEPSQFDIYLVPTDGSGKTTVLVKHPANERTLGWVPGRDDLLFLSDRSGTWDVWVLTVRDGRPVGEPAGVYANLGNVIPIGFTKDGTYFYEVYSRWQGSFVTAFDYRTGKPIGRLNQPLVGYKRSLDWSPDDQQLAYVEVKTRPVGPGHLVGYLHIKDLKTGEDRIIPCGLRGVIDVRWSPNGQLLLICGFKTKKIVDYRKKTELYIVNPETGVIRCVAENPNQRIVIGEWTADSQGIYFVRGDSLFLYDVKSGQEKEVLNQAHMTGFIALSPDEHGLVIKTSNREEKTEALVYLNLSSGASKQLVTYSQRNVLLGFDYSPDGRFLYYLKRGDEGTSLCRIATRDNRHEEVWRTTKYIRDLRFHPDKQQIIFTETQHDTAVWVMENLLPKESTSN
jgi:Tol biopolymer transport system component